MDNIYGAFERKDRGSYSQIELINDLFLKKLIYSIKQNIFLKNLFFP